MISLTRLAVLASVAALFMAGAAEAATVGPHGPAGVTCYSDGKVTVAPNLDKAGYGPQTLGYMVWFRDRRSGVWSSSRWFLYYSPQGPVVNVGKTWFPMSPSDYDVVVDYAWNLGSGWGTARAWTPSYTIGGDFFGYPESTCRAMPHNVTVTGCADYGNLPGVAPCPRSLRGRGRTAGARRARVSRAKRHVVRAPRITLR